MIAKQRLFGGLGATAESDNVFRILSILGTKMEPKMWLQTGLICK